MPLTPFHWAIVVLGFLFFETFYIPALIVSSVVMDIEPSYYLFISPPVDGVLHGFFHTYIGVTLLGLLVALVLLKTKKFADKIMGFFKLEQKNISAKQIFISSIIGVWSHVFFDSFMHLDIKPFWPIEFNPFLGLIDRQMIYLITSVLIVISITLYFLRLTKK